MNSLMTFGLHRHWRAATARAAIAPLLRNPDRPLHAGHGRGEGAFCTPSGPSRKPAVAFRTARCASPRGRISLSHAGQGRIVRARPSCPPIPKAAAEALHRRAALRPLSGVAGHWRSTPALGTGDLALAVARAGAGRVIAADFSETMLAAARRKPAGKRRRREHRSGRRRRDAATVRRTDLRLRRQRFRPSQRRREPAGYALPNCTPRSSRPIGQLACLRRNHPSPAADRAVLPAYFFRADRSARWPASSPATRPRTAICPRRSIASPTSNASRHSCAPPSFTDVRYRRLGLGVVALHTATRPPLAPDKPISSSPTAGEEP